MIFRRKTLPAAVKPTSEPLMTSNDRTRIDPSVPRKKILVVDDDPVTLQALSQKLTSKGFHVVTAEDGSQALYATREEKPDLVLLDVNLAPNVSGPDWNAFLLVQWLRHMNLVRNASILVMSASDREDYKQRASAVGARGFVCKQDSERLFASIDRVLAPKPATEAAGAI